MAPGGRKKGRCDAAGEAAEIAVEGSYPVTTVCRILHAPRSTIYHRRSKGHERCRPGPKTDISDEQLLRAIRLVLEKSPFCGEGYRKVRAACAASRAFTPAASGCCA